MGVGRRGDADDQLARVAVADDAAKQFVADGLREPIGGLRPLRDERPCGREHSELYARGLTRDSYQRVSGRISKRVCCRSARLGVGTIRGHGPCLSGRSNSEEASLGLAQRLLERCVIKLAGLLGSPLAALTRGG